MKQQAALLAQLRQIVGPEGWVNDPTIIAADATDWRKRYVGAPLAVVEPANTKEVAAIVRLAAQTRTAIVPQGGNTSLCGGATPDTSGQQIILRLSRMHRVLDVDAVANTLTAEAGCTLAQVHQAAGAAGRLFPLNIASESLCEVGGNLSTNAGGVQVLRYGNMRSLVLGLEVVLPSGEIWDGLRALRKDNTGYDLKQLFVGAEGTLGIITAAVLKLFAKPTAYATAFVALRTQQDALALLASMQSACGDRLSAFELLSSLCLQLVRKYFPQGPAPFAPSYPHYVLVELSDTQDGAALDALLERTLSASVRQGIALDFTVAANPARAAQLWSLRKNISDAQAAEGKNIKHDISLPISKIASFITETDAKLERAFPGVCVVCFGHVGDGNLHYNVVPPQGTAEADFAALQSAVNRVVHDQVSAFGGSISAEHGLGQYKREEILRYKSPLEMELMRSIKRTLDPLGIMNPGKVL